MNDSDVSKQIQQMVRFIRQEAEEKANEISVSAEEVFHFLHSSPFSHLSFPIDALNPNRVFLYSGIQYREAAVGRSWEEEDQARIRMQRETSRNSKEDVTSYIPFYTLFGCCSCSCSCFFFFFLSEILEIGWQLVDIRWKLKLRFLLV